MALEVMRAETHLIPSLIPQRYHGPRNQQPERHHPFKNAAAAAVIAAADALAGDNQSEVTRAGAIHRRDCQRRDDPRRDGRGRDETAGGDRKARVRPQPAGLLSFAYEPNSYDLIVSEFALHHLPDFWKAVALSRIFNALKPGANFYLRDIVFVAMPDGIERDVEGWADFSIKNHEFDRESVITHMRDEYSTFSWVMERMLTDVGFQIVSADYHAPLHATYLLRKPKAGDQS